MSAEREARQFREVDAAAAKDAYRAALEGLDLTPEELLLGKVDKEGEIVWSGSPRSLFKHPRTMSTIEGIVEAIFGPDTADETDSGG